MTATAHKTHKKVWIKTPNLTVPYKDARCQRLRVKTYKTENQTFEEMRNYPGWIQVV